MKWGYYTTRFIISITLKGTGYIFNLAWRVKCESHRQTVQYRLKIGLHWVKQLIYTYISDNK